jgi:hypothetical protein
VPLLLQSAAECLEAHPVTMGVPFPKGALHDPHAIRLENADGPVPAQTEVLARWSDGSVKWLLLDFVTNGLREGTNEWLLHPAEGVAKSELGEPLRVTETASAVVVETGAATFHISRTRLQPFAQVRIGGADALEPDGSCVRLTGPKGAPGIGRVEELAVEARGPVRATLRLRGRFTGQCGLRFTARLSFFAGTGLVRLDLTVHNPRRAQHPGGLWDLGDGGSVLFCDLSLGLKLRGDSAPRVSWTAESGTLAEVTGAATLELYQDSSGGDNWRSRNHVNRHGDVPLAFRGYRLRRDGDEQTGLRASPVVRLEGEAGALTVAVPEFWQQFPKALEVADRLVTVRLFPGQFGDLFELQGGERKTHTVWLHFGPAGRTCPALDWVHRPSAVRAMPAWYAASGAVPYLPPTPPDSGDRLGELLAAAIEGANSFFARRDVIDEYGWRNYGELYADHEAAGHTGPAPLISHYNNQYDVVYGAILQYLRTGDPRWRDVFDPLARHVMDTDVYHTDRDKAAYNGGLFWHTSHYKDAGTATHRTYARSHCPGNRAYGGGPGNAHNYTAGLLHYFYLTGDPNARDVVISLADWVVNMDDGRQTIFGLIDDGPTGLASEGGQVYLHGPARGSGNSINALMDAWLLTGRRRYLENAEGLIRRTIHPHDDLAANDLLDVEPRWSYTVYLTVLARYLNLKAEAGELDFMYSYARSSLRRYAVWMLNNERPYFDQAEKLEFPTETWAAQEFRKANVFRLAAAHFAEPQRSRLLRRGDQFAERAWHDLLRFESRTATRALAILMTEGTKDAYFRQTRPDPAPPGPGSHEFGAPRPFVPQKTRVSRQLRSLSGLLRAVVRLCNPWRWPGLRHWPR